MLPIEQQVVAFTRLIFASVGRSVSARPWPEL
jgi:hypothetical protein